MEKFLGKIESEGHMLQLYVIQYGGGFFWADLTVAEDDMAICAYNTAHPGVTALEEYLYCRQQGIPCGIIRNPRFRIDPKDLA